MTPDGARVVVTGISTGRPDDWDYTTMGLTASTGRKRWVRRYTGPT